MKTPLELFMFFVILKGFEILHVAQAQEVITCLETTIGSDECKEYIFADTTHNLTWGSARQFCKNLSDIVGFDMDLVAIETKKENDVLMEYIALTYNVTSFWTSGYDPAKTKAFLWESTGYIVAYYDWLEDQPTYSIPEQDVIAIRRFADDRGTGWGDYLQTTTDYHPLCERVSILVKDGGQK